MTVKISKQMVYTYEMGDKESRVLDMVLDEWIKNNQDDPMREIIKNLSEAVKYNLKS